MNDMCTTYSSVHQSFIISVGVNVCKKIIFFFIPIINLLNANIGCIINKMNGIKIANDKNSILLFHYFRLT